MPIVNNCAFCFTLRQGTIASGVFTMIVSLCMLGIGGWVAFEHADDVANDKDSETKKLIVMISGASFILFGMLILCMSILLLVGVKNERKRLLTPWMIIIAIWIVTSILRTILVFMKNIGSTPEKVVGVIGIFQFSYILIVVYSYYKSLDAPTTPILTNQQQVRVMPTGYVPIGTINHQETTLP